MLDGVMRKARQAPTQLSPNDAARLQHSIGNRTTGVLLGKGNSAENTSQQSLAEIQRRIERLGIQTKLTVGSTNTHEERQADNVAKTAVQRLNEPKTDSNEQQGKHKNRVSDVFFRDRVPDVARVTTLEGGLIQRELTSRADRAFTQAIKHNPELETFKQYTDAYMPTKHQDELSKLRGLSRVKKSPEAEKRLKDFIRAFLLSNYAERLHAIETDDNKAGKYASEKERREKYYTKAKQQRDEFAPLIKKGVNAPETLGFLHEFNFIEGIPKQAINRVETRTRGPRIDVRSTFIGGRTLGMRLRAHLLIVYTARDGTQYYFRGGPSSADPENPGNTKAEYGLYTPQVADYDPSSPVTTVLKGDEAESKLDALIEATQAINQMAVPYRAQIGSLASSRGENCNATAWTILTRAGIKPGKPFGSHPGWGYQLGSQTQGKENAMPEPEDNDVEDTISMALDPTTVVTVKGGLIPAYRDRAFFEKAVFLTGGVRVGVLADTPQFLKIVDDEKQILYIPRNPEFVRRQAIVATMTYLKHNQLTASQDLFAIAYNRNRENVPTKESIAETLGVDVELVAYTALQMQNDAKDFLISQLNLREDSDVQTIGESKVGLMRLLQEHTIFSGRSVGKTANELVNDVPDFTGIGQIAHATRQSVEKIKLLVEQLRPARNRGHHIAPTIARFAKIGILAELASGNSKRATRTTAMIAARNLGVDLSYVLEKCRVMWPQYAPVNPVIAQQVEDEIEDEESSVLGEDQLENFLGGGDESEIDSGAIDDFLQGDMDVLSTGNQAENYEDDGEESMLDEGDFAAFLQGEDIQVGGLGELEQKSLMEGSEVDDGLSNQTIQQPVGVFEDDNDSINPEDMDDLLKDLLN